MHALAAPLVLDLVRFLDDVRAQALKRLLAIPRGAVRRVQALHDLDERRSEKPDRHGQQIHLRRRWHGRVDDSNERRYGKRDFRMQRQEHTKRLKDTLLRAAWLGSANLAGLRGRN